MADITLGTMLQVQDMDYVPEQTKAIREAGYECVQVHFMTADLTLDDAKVVKQALDGEGLFAAAVCCHLAHNKAADFAFTSTEGTKWLIEAAGVCDSPRVVLWSGSNSNNLRGEDIYNFTPAAMDMLEMSFREFVPAAEAAGVQLCIEPFYPHVLGTPRRMRSFCERFPDHTVACAMDVPNFIAHNLYEQMNELIPSIIREVGEYIGIVHFKDIRQNEVGVLTLPGPGGGVLDYPLVIQELRALGRPLVGITEHMPFDEIGEAREFIAGLL